MRLERQCLTLYFGHDHETRNETVDYPVSTVWLNSLPLSACFVIKYNNAYRIDMSTSRDMICLPQIFKQILWHYSEILSPMQYYKVKCWKYYRQLHANFVIITKEILDTAAVVLFYCILLIWTFIENEHYDFLLWKQAR